MFLIFYLLFFNYLEFLNVNWIESRIANLREERTRQEKQVKSLESTLAVEQARTRMLETEQSTLRDKEKSLLAQLELRAIEVAALKKRLDERACADAQTHLHSQVSTRQHSWIRIYIELLSFGIGRDENSFPGYLRQS